MSPISLVGAILRKHKTVMNQQQFEKIITYLQGTISPDEAAVLRKWIDEKEENKALFEKYLRLYRESQCMGFEGGFNGDVSWKLLNERMQRRAVRQRIVAHVAVAASILIAIVSGALLLNNNKIEESSLAITEIHKPDNVSVKLHMADGQTLSLKEDECISIQESDGTKIKTDGSRGLTYQANTDNLPVVEHMIEIPVGGSYEMTLADGTKVWLNSASKLRFPTRFAGNRREVFLEGEAYFEVAKNERMPFIVHAGQSEIKVLGTAFNVSAYSQENTVTTLAKGHVEVNCNDVVAELLPGKQAVVDRTGRINTRNVDVSLYTSWLQGVFEFENMSLYEIASKLSRWYGVDFDFVDRSCMERRFTGGFKKTDPANECLEIIEKTTDVKFYITNNSIKVTYRKGEF